MGITGIVGIVRWAPWGRNMPRWTDFHLVACPAKDSHPSSSHSWWSYLRYFRISLFSGSRNCFSFLFPISFFYYFFSSFVFENNSESAAPFAAPSPYIGWPRSRVKTNLRHRHRIWQFSFDADHMKILLFFTICTKYIGINGINFITWKDRGHNPKVWCEKVKI